MVVNENRDTIAKKRRFFFNSIFLITQIIAVINRTNFNNPFQEEKELPVGYFMVEMSKERLPVEEPANDLNFIL
jgi:hypothetical protein